MAATPSTTTKVTPIAMYAVAGFMLEQRLPAPMRISGPSHCVHSEKAVRLDVYVDDSETWCEATDAEYVDTKTGTVDGDTFTLVTFRGKVPAAVGDVAVLIRIAQRVDNPRPALALVGGETA